MKATNWISQIEQHVPVQFHDIYGKDIQNQKNRIIQALNAFIDLYGDCDVRLFSAPGRTEIGGNHTDHNHGKVLAASVNLDVIAVVAENHSDVIRIKSEGHNENVIEITDLSVHEQEKNSSNSLIRGICAKFVQMGYPINGFCAYTTSDVFSGSGLSSSAAFEVLVCTVLEHLAGITIDSVEKAIISQYAENVYFGKPCGLMDQTACAYGGLITIDFKNPSKPEVQKVNYDFSKSGYCLCITAPGGSHAGLSGEYAAVTEEMAVISDFLGTKYLRDASFEEFVKEAPELIKKTSHRAVLRAYHFYKENERVDAQVNALNRGDFPAFLKEVEKSGQSSYMYLQNVYCSGDPENQGLSLALAFSENILKEKGVCRVHGGGFAGTIQAFVPVEEAEQYQSEMNRLFGDQACMILTIRPCGGIEFTL